MVIAPPPTCWERLRGKAIVVRMILDPWIFAVFILVVYFFAGIRGHDAALWIVPLIMMILSVASLFLALKEYENRSKQHMDVEMKDPMSSSNRSTSAVEPRVGMGPTILCALRLFAILIALVVGIYGDLRYLREYHRLSRGASYHNVIPTEPAAGKFDATSIVFASGSMINPDQVYGFVDKYTFTVFCLAPIVRPGNTSGTNMVHFWATGINCCEPRQNFHCGQVIDDKATGAVRLTRTDREDHRFHKAVRAAEDEYGLTTTPAYILLDIIEDPIGYKKSLYNKTGVLYIIFAAAYFVVSLLLGMGLDSACVGISSR